MLQNLLKILFLLIKLALLFTLFYQCFISLITLKFENIFTLNFYLMKILDLVLFNCIFPNFIEVFNQLNFKKIFGDQDFFDVVSNPNLKFKFKTDSKLSPNHQRWGEEGKDIPKNLNQLIFKLNGEDGKIEVSNLTLKG